MQDKLWQYKQVESLKVGDSTIVLNEKGELEEVTIAGISTNSGHKVRFYKLNVEEVDNYFANSIVTHNTEGGKGPDKSCKPKSDKELKATELLKSCGKDAPKPKGCRTTKDEKDKGDAADKEFCDKMGGKTCGGLGIVEAFIEGAIKDGLKDCPLSDDDIDTLVSAACEAAEGCGGGGGGGNCVREDTLIHTPGGNVVVSDLKPGDDVLSYDIKGMIDSNDPSWPLWTTKTLEGRLAVSKVVFNKNSYWHAWYEILLSNGRTLNITYEHPVLVKSQGYPSL